MKCYLLAHNMHRIFFERGGTAASEAGYAAVMSQNTRKLAKNYLTGPSKIYQWAPWKRVAPGIPPCCSKQLWNHCLSDLQTHLQDNRLFCNSTAESWSNVITFFYPAWLIRPIYCFISLRWSVGAENSVFQVRHFESLFPMTVTIDIFSGPWTKERGN